MISGSKGAPVEGAVGLQKCWWDAAKERRVLMARFAQLLNRSQRRVFRSSPVASQRGLECTAWWRIQYERDEQSRLSRCHPFRGLLGWRQDTRQNSRTGHGRAWSARRTRLHPAFCSQSDFSAPDSTTSSSLTGSTVPGSQLSPKPQLYFLPVDAGRPRRTSTSSRSWTHWQLSLPHHRDHCLPLRNAGPFRTSRCAAVELSL
jgi:hypothetical protein